jgi:hypothetical protein
VCTCAIFRVYGKDGRSEYLIPELDISSARCRTSWDQSKAVIRLFTLKVAKNGLPWSYAESACPSSLGVAPRSILALFGGFSSVEGSTKLTR